MHILNAHMVRTYPEAHIRTHIYVCTYETHINGDPIDYELSVKTSVLYHSGNGATREAADTTLRRDERCSTHAVTP